jgi:hypothetical protein
VAIRGRTYAVDLLASREPGRETSLGLIILRQTEEGQRLDETLIQTWRWDDLQEHKFPEPFLEGAMDRDTLLTLAKAALTMAGLKDLVRRIKDAEEA